MPALDRAAWRPGEGTLPDDPERAVRAHVHVALASVLLVFFAPVVSWALWLFDRRAPPGPWRRRLLAIAVADSALVLALGLATAAGLPVGQAHEPPRIGVALDARGPGDGAVVVRVAPGGPAAAASIEPGDLIVEVEGAPVEDGPDLVDAIGRTPDGARRHLVVLRGGERVDVVVTPSRDAPEPRRAPAPLFAPAEEGERGLARRVGGHFVTWAGIVELGLVTALTVAGRRRRAPVGPGIAVLGGLVALTVVSGGVLAAFQATVGLSLGALLVAVVSGSAGLLVVGLLAVRRLPSPPVRIGAPMRAPRAVALGVFYGITGGARVGLVLGLLAAAGLPSRDAAGAFGLDASWGAGGVALFVVATVVVAPVAEELVFRGVLLPWLARWMAPAAALAWSALTFAVGHLYYGAGALLIAYYGLVLGWARLRTGALWAPIALHALLNGATALALLA